MTLAFPTKLSVNHQALFIILIHNSQLSPIVDRINSAETASYVTDTKYGQETGDKFFYISLHMLNK